MSGNADAELNIVVNDNVAQASSRILSQVRALGAAMNAEAGKIDRTAASVAKSLNKMSGGGIGSVPGTYSKSIAQATANVAKYRAEMEKLSHVENAKVNKAGKPYDAQTGKLISRADMDAYDQAKVKVKVYSDELERLTKLQAEVAKPKGVATSIGDGKQARSGFDSYSASPRFDDFARYRAEAEGLDRSTKALQKTYSDMWGKVESVNGKGTSWWPPEALRSTENFTRALMETSNATRYMLYDVSRNFAIAGAAAIAFGSAGIIMAARWEAAFAEVERTVGGSDAVMSRIREGLINLSQDLPVSFSELTEIAALGAQMGIAADGIVAYTDVIAKLTATTNLSADAAGKALGRFRSFFSEAEDSSLAVTEATFTNLASSILKVGVNSVATETGIVNVGTQISSMGSYAGFTADQVIGLAGALSSVGVPPELSRGVTARLFAIMGEAASSGGEKLERFAHTAGVSASEFQAAWGTEDFAYIFTDFISGLNDMNQNGGKAIETLNELGIRGVRDVPVLLRLAGAANEAGVQGGLLAQTMNDARSGWRDNIELQLQYNKIAGTLSARFQVLIQNFEALFATMGEGSTGPIKGLVDFFIQLVKGMTAVAQTPLGQVFSTVSIGAALLLGSITLLVAGFARAGAAAIGFGGAMQAMGFSAERATVATRILGISLAALGVVGIIAAVAGGIFALGSAASEASNAVTDTQGALAALKKDTQDASDNVGRVLFEISDGTGAAANGLKLTATQADNLAAVSTHVEDRMHGSAKAVKSVGEQLGVTSLAFGQASRSFVKNSLIASKAFTDLFAESAGGFGEKFANGGNLDEAITIYATKGREAAQAYVEGITGVDTNTALLGNMDIAGFGGGDKAAGVAQRKFLDQIEGTVNGMKAAGLASLAAGEGIKTFTSATEISTEALEEFQAQNEEAIGGLAEGYSKFVSSGTLIGLTQQMKAAFETVDDGTTEVDEHATAIGEFETAWRDAYGGASFSIGEYMTVFRRAAEEQAQFTTNLQTLAARGLPQDIIGDLAEMGPEAQRLVEALVNSTDTELQEYIDLYGKTGFSSMVALAANQLAAQQIVKNAMATIGVEGVRLLNQKLTEGASLEGALKELQLDANGNPIKPKTEVDVQREKNRKLVNDAFSNLGISVPINPYLTKTQIIQAPSMNGQKVTIGMYDTGGYTGRGGRLDPAGVVHRGEYVHPKSDVDQRTGLPKPEAMMRMMKSGRPAPRGTGGSYATGGFVNPGVNTTHLAVEDRQLLVDIANAIRSGLTISERTVTGLVNAGNIGSTGRSSG